MKDSTINVAEVIDAAKIGSWQILVLVLCCSSLVVDGFDVQAMGYVAPAILHDWKIDKASLGPVFGAGLFGLLIGTLLFSIAADKFGRRPVLIWSTFFFGICMLVTPFTGNVGELMVLRFVTGLGLGGIMPNAVALAGEFSPQRKRANVVMIMSCGFTIGAMCSGLLSAVLIPSLGWHSVFYVGGALPLLIGCVMLRYLPESMQWQLLRGDNQSRVGIWLQRIDPALTVEPGTRFVVHEENSKGIPVFALLKEQRASSTLLLWVASFMNLLTLYSLSSWLPTVAVSSGLSTSNAVLVGTMLQFGGIVGAILMASMIERIGFRRVLVPCFIVAAVSIALVGQSIGSLALIFVLIFVAGFCINGGQPAINAIAVRFYPTTLRATGVGWTVGIGRVGAVIGPVIGGELIRLNWGQDLLFAAVALPSLISTLAIWILTRKRFNTGTTGWRAGADTSIPNFDPSTSP